MAETRTAVPVIPRDSRTPALPFKTLSRAAAALWRECVARRVPHGLISLGYLHPRPHPAIAFHRALWLDALPGWPRALVAVVETTLWLRWMLFGAWRATWRAMRVNDAAMRAHGGAPTRRQALRILGLALRFGIPPQQAVLFGLQSGPTDERRGAEDPALDYVFEQERAAWHRYTNASDPHWDRAVALLRDKVTLAKHLSTAGITVASTFATWEPGEPSDLKAWLDARVPDGATAWPGLFFKLRDGRGGLDAFAAWQRHGCWESSRMGGHPVRGLQEVQALWQALTKHGAVIVQPRLTTHPALAPLSGNDEAVTLRLITHRGPGRTHMAMAMLEAPLGREGLHAIWPINAADGAVLQSTWNGWPANRAHEADVPALRVPDPALRIPGWERLCAQSVQAHVAVAALAFIAWDWIVTADGARLLEGNSGWTTTVPQCLFGPLCGVERQR